MKFTRLSLAALASAIAITACTADLPHEAPYDAKAPLSKQARAQLKGTIRLENETDFSQITVQLQNSERTYSVQTLPDGSVALTGVVPGEYSLSIVTRYFQAVSETVEIALAETVDLGDRTLPAKRALVSGAALLEDRNGNQIGGVAVKLVRSGSLRGGGATAPSGLRSTAAAADAVPEKVYTTLSNFDGSFQVDEVPAGIYSVFYEKAGIASDQITDVEVTGEDGAVSIDEMVLLPMFGSLTILGTNAADAVSTTTVNVALTPTGSPAFFAQLSWDAEFIAPFAPFDFTTPTVSIALPGSGVDGLKTLYVRYFDSLGNQSTVGSDTVILDTTEPENTSFGIVQASPTDQNPLNLTLSADGATHMSVSESCSVINWETYAQTKAHILTSSAEGNKTIAVRFRDAVDNRSSCLTQSIYFDDVDPTLNPFPVQINFGAASTSNSTVSVAFNVTGATEVKVSEDSSLADSPWMPYTPTRSFPLSAGNGTKTVYAIFRDGANNQTVIVNDTIVLDTTVIGTPFVTIQSEVTSSTTVTVNFAASNSSEMWYSEQSDFSTGTWEPYVGVKNVTFSGGDGTKNLYVKFRKASGEQSAVASDSYVLDTVAPVFPIIRVNNGATVVGEPIVTVNLSAVDATSGLAVYRINTVDSFGLVPNRTYQPNDVFTLAGDDGIKTLYVTFFDHAGQYSATASVSVTLDTTAPVVSSASLEQLDGTTLTTGDIVRDGRVVLRSTVVDTTALEMQVSTTSTTSLGWEPYNANKVIDLTAATSNITALVRDAAGRITPLLTTTVIKLDSVAPVLAMSRTSASPTNNLTVSLNLGAEAGSSTQVSADPGFGDADWFPIQNTTVVLTAGDGIRTIYGRAKDAAGNVSDLKTVTVTIDQTPPQNASFTIAAESLTNNRALSLTYSGVDINKVRVAENACGGAYGAHTGGDTFNITSLGDGLKTIAVQFQDAVGNESGCLTKSITLDETDPVFGYVFINSNVTYATNRTVSIGISVTGATDMQLSESAVFTGASWLPVTDSATLTLSAGEGVKTVFARFRDTATNMISGFSDSIIVDTVAPVFSAMTGPAASNNISVPLALTASGADKMRLSENADFSGASWTVFNDTPTFTIANTQGQHTIYVQLRDNATNESISRSHSVTLDSAAPDVPVVSIVGGGYTKLAGITVQTIADGATEIQISQDSGFSGATWMPYSQLKSFTLVGGEATYTVYIKVRDAALNESGSVSASVTLDQTAPQVFMRAEDGQGNFLTQTNVTRYYMHLTVTDATPVLAQFNSLSSFSGATSEAVAALRTWDVVAPTVASGANYSTYVRVVDAAGNATVVGPVTVLVDTIGPTGATLALSPGLTSDTTVDVNLSANNADFVELSEDISFLSSTSIVYIATTSHTFGAGDGTKTLYARYVDTLGNYSAIVAASTTLDQTAPENPALSITQTSPTKQTSLDLTLSANGATQMAISEGVCGSGWESYTQSKVFALSTSAGLEADKVIAVRFRDAVNNTTGCITKTIRFDNAPPVIVTAFEVNYGASSTSSGIVTLSVQVTGADAMQVSENNSFTDAAWLPYSDLRTFTLSAGNETKTVYARFRDNADNQTATVSDSIILDTTPISTPFVTIQAAATSSTTVNVNLAASNIDQMTLSHLNDFSVGTGWVSYQATTDYTFPTGDGIKTLYAKFRKTSGIESVAVSDTYILDTTPPILPSVRVNNGATVVDNALVTLNLSAVDETSGLSVYRLNTANSFAAIADKAYQTNDVYTLSPGDGLKTLWVAFGDQARNYSTAASVAVLLDTAAPVVWTVTLQRLDGTTINNGDTVKDGRVILASTVTDSTTLEMQVTTNGSFASLGWEPYNPSKVIDFTTASSTLAARVRDAAGHITDLLSGFTVNLDNTAPVLTFSRTSVSPSNSLSVGLSFSATETSQYQVSESPGLAGAAWSSAASQTFVLVPGDGLRSLFARAKDAAGNLSDIESVTVSIDQTPPQGGAFVINAGAFTKTRTVALTYSANDAADVRSIEGAVCGGTYASFGTAGTVALTSPADGAKSISVQFRDAVGNETACLTKTVTLDETPPEVGFIALDGAALYTTGRIVTASISVTGAVEMQVSENASFTGVSWIPVTDSTVVTLSATDGLKTMYARFRDEAGNVSVSTSDTITLDTIAPVFNSFSAVAVTNSTTLSASLLASAASEMRLSENADFSGASWVAYLTPSNFSLTDVDGSHTVFAQMRDQAGNLSVVRSLAVTIDRTAPVVVSVDINEVPLTRLLNIGILSVVEDAAQMMASESPTFAGATWQSYLGQRAFALAAGADGLRNVYVKYRDLAGNETARVDLSTTLDLTLPALTSFVINGGASYARLSVVSLALAASDTNGVSELTVSDNSGFVGAMWEPFTTSTGWLLSNSDGAKDLFVKVRDAAGNVSLPLTASIVLDSQAPYNGFLAINSGAAAANNRVLTLALSAVGATEMIIGLSSDFAGASWVPYAAAATIDALNDGNRTVYARFRDSAQNTSEIAQGSIVVDTAAPTVSLVKINESPVSNTLSLTLTLSANGASEMQLSEAADFNLAVWQAYQSSPAFVLSAAPDGTRTVHVRFRDTALNETVDYPVSIDIDRTGPTGPALSINADATYATQQLVALTLAATDVESMIVSESATFVGAAWEPFAQQKAFLMSTGEGGKTIYAKFRDLVGNESSAVSAAIVFDPTAPQSPLMFIATPKTGYASQVTVPLVLSASGASEMLISESTAFTDATWQAYNASLNFVLSNQQGSHSVYTKFRDAAGNESFIVSAAVLLDTVKPTINRVEVEGNPTWVNDKTLSLTLLATGADTMKLSLNSDLSLVAEQPYSSVAAFDLADADGFQTLYVEFQDAAGNQSSVYSLGLNLDRAAPAGVTISIAGGALYTSSRSVDVQLAIDGTATDYMVSEDINFGGASWLSLSPAATTSYTLSYSLQTVGEGVKRVYAKVRDQAGNSSVATYADITLDSVPPQNVFIRKSNQPYDYSNTVAVLFDVGANGASEMRVSTDGIFDTENWASVTATTSLAFSGDGLKNAYVQFRDLAANESSMGQTSFFLDTVAPSAGTVEFKDGLYTNRTNVFLSLSAGGADFFQVSADGVFDTELQQSMQPGIPLTLPAGDGIKIYSIRFGDNAGNYSSTVTAYTTLDTVPPVAGTPAIEINAGDAYTAVQVVSLAFLVDGATDMQVRNQPFLDNFGSWEAVTTATTWFLEQNEGMKTVNVWFRDAAGNIAGPYSDAITLDNRAPDIGGIFVNFGNEYTNDSVLNVSINAPGGAASEMRYSTDSAFADATWGPYASGFTLAVANTDGIKTVYAQFRDAALNVSTVYQDSIVLDTTAPGSATVTIDSGSAYTRNGNVTLALGATDTLSGVFQMQVSNDGVFDTEILEPIPPQRFWMLDTVADGTKYVWVRFVDKAGNYSTAVSDGIILDRLAPTSTSIVLDAGAVYTTASVALVTLAATDANVVSSYMLADNPGFGGAFWQDFTTATSTLLPSMEGQIKIYVKYRDAAGNESNPVFDDILRDTLAPQFDGLNAPALTSSLTVNLQLFAPLAPNATLMRLSEDSNFTAASWVTFATSASFSLSAGEGVKTIYAQLQDDAGHTSVVRSVNVTVDQSAPTLPVVRITQGTYVNTTNIQVETIVDSASEMLISQYAPMTDATWQPFNQSKPFVLSSGDGSKTIYVKVKDTAGNVSAAGSAVVILDTTPPVVSLFQARDVLGTVITQSNNLRYYLYLTASDANGMTAQFSPDLNFNGAAVETFTSPLTRQWDVPQPFADNGENRDAYVLVRDAAGNTATAGPVTVLVDTVGPKNPTLSLSPSLISTTTVTVNLSATNAQYVELSQDISFLASTFFSMQATTTYTLAAGDGEKRLYARYVDTLGNYSVVVEAKSTLDTVAPVVQSVVVSEGTVTNQLTVHLAFSVLDAAQMQVGENGCGGSWGTYNEAYAHSFTSTTEGVRSLAVRFRDGAGNATACYTKSITLDRTPPTLTAGKGVVINSDAAYVNGNFVTLALNVTGASTMMLSNNSSFGGSQVMPITTATQWSLDPGDGNRTVYARFFDAAGNTRDGGSDSITVDATPPSNTAVAIDAGASYAITSAVTLTLSASDAQPVQMIISNDGIFDTETAEAFSISKAWSLSPGDGNKTVYVRFVDAAGNGSNTVSASIFVDSLGPVGTSVLIDGNATSTSDILGNVTLSLAAFDGSGVAKMKLANLTAGDCASALAPAPEETYQTVKSWVLADIGANKEGNRYVCAVFRDGAGSWSSPVSDAVFYDTLFPTAGAGAITLNGGALYSASTFVQVALNATGASDMKLGTDPALSGAAWEAYATNKTWTFASGGDGVDRTLFVQYRDSSGNATGIYSDAITVDTQAPVSLSMTLDGGTEYAVAEPNYTRDITYEVTLGATNWTLVQVSDDVGFQNLLTTATPATVFPVSVSFSTGNRLDGAKTVYARFLDGAGNVSAIISRVINLDSGEPSPVNILVNAGASSTSAPDGVVQLTMSATDSGSGINKMRLSNTLAGLPGASEEPYNGNKLWALSGFGAGQEGYRWVYFQVADKAGNYSTPVSDTILYDTLAPMVNSITFLTPQPSPSRTADVLFNVSGATEMILGHDIGFTNRSWEPYNTNRSWTFNAGGDGVGQTLYVKFRDAAGNTTLEQTPTFTIDDVAPQSPVVGINGGIENVPRTAYSWDGEFEIDTLSATGAWDHVDIAADPSFSAMLRTVTFGEFLPISVNPGFFTTDGLKTIYARFVDAEGNISTIVSGSFTIDSSPPVVTRVLINGYDLTAMQSWESVPVTDITGQITVTVEATDVGTGVEQEEITISGTGGGAFGPAAFNPQPKTVQLTNLLFDGYRNFDLTVTDKAGNPVFYNRLNAINYVTNADNTWSIQLRDKLTDSSVFTDSREVKVHFNNSRPLKAYQISENATFSGATWVVLNDLSFGQDYLFTMTSGGDEISKTLYARYRDELGLVSTGESASIILDDTPPAQPSVTLAPTYYVNGGGSVDINYTFGSVNDVLQVSGFADFSAPSDYYQWMGQPLNFNIGFVQEGPQKLYFRARDGAWNWSDTYIWDYFGDTFQPTVNSLSLNNDATITNSIAMTLAIDAQDFMPGSGLSKVIISPVSNCDLANPSTLVKNYATSVAFTHWDNWSGMHSIYVCVSDAAGNLSAAQQKLIDVDFDAPAVNTFLVNDLDGVVGSPSVSITATSSDGGIEVQLANEATFTGASWQPVGASIGWVLTAGDGTKDVYARFRDAAGNVSVTEHTTIILDTQGPNQPALQIIDIDSDGFALSNNSVEMQWSIPVGTQSFDLQRLVTGVDTDFVTVATPSGVTSTYIDILVDAGKRHRYRIRAQDSAGNWSAWSNVAEASPYEPLTGAGWIRYGAQFAYAFPPSAGTFTLSPTYLHEDGLGITFIETLAQNITEWLRPLPPQTYFNEVLNLRTANQDSSLVYDSKVPLDFNVRESIADSWGQTSIAVDSKDKLHICHRTSTGYLGYATNKTGVWTTQTFTAVTFFYGCSVAVDDQNHAYIAVWSGWAPGDLVLYHDSGEILHDDFESNLGSTNWASATAGVERNGLGIGEPSGTASLDLDGGTDIVESVDLSAYSNLTYSYYFERTGGGEMPDAGDYLRFEAFDGLVWNTLNTHTNASGAATGYTLVSGSLPAGTQKVRFRSTGSGEGFDDFFVDDFRVNTTAGTWLSQTIDAGPNDVGLNPSIKLDANNKVHIAYLDETNDDLKYANNVTDSWDISIVDATGNVGREPSLAIDPSGKPAILYRDVTGTDLKFAILTAGSWAFSVADATNSLYPSLAFDTAGDASISYTQSGVLMFKQRVAGVWGTPVSVDGSSPFIASNSISVDGDGFSHIGYYDSTNRNLRYATNATGAWVKTNLDELGDVGDDVGIAMDATGKAHISYYDATLNALKHTSYVAADWVPWRSTTIDSTGSVGQYPSVAQDGNGAIHVAYYDQSNTALKYATNAGGSWAVVQVDNAASVGSYSSLALSASGKAYISYYDATNTDLKFATNESGSWVVSTIEASASDVGRHNDIVVDGSGNIYIVYYTSGGTTVRFIWRNTSAVWSVPVNVGGSYGNNSLAIDSTGTLHLVYRGSSGGLRYQSGVPGAWSAAVQVNPRDPFYGTAITVDTSDKVHIAAYGGWPGRLEYVTNKTGSWVVQTVEADGDAGTYPTIAADENEAVHIFHQRASNLRYATNQAGFWQRSTIDAAGINGYNSSVVRDNKGRLHVMYFDGTNGDLDYTYGFFSGWLPASSILRTTPF